MERLLAKDLKAAAGRQVRVRGWLHNQRVLGKVAFLVLRDRSGHIQIVVEDKETIKEIAHLHIGTVLEVRGEAVASEKAESGVEIVKPRVHVESPVTAPPPIDYFKPEITNTDLEGLLDQRPIALRHRPIQAVFRLQAGIAHAYQLYMHDVVGAVEYFAPNMIGASSEGGAEFFKVDYFGYPATLAQSSQLYKQMMVGVNERVFALMPFFRAEKSNTIRHLTEGKQFEFEMGFFDSWTEVMDINEGVVKAIVHHLESHYAHDLAALGDPLIRIPQDARFPRVTFAEAQEIYFKRTGIDERHEPDLSPAAERELCRFALEEHGTECIFVTHWKTEKRPFYSMPNENDPTITNTFDLLCGGAEIVSGGQRRHTYDSMREGIVMKGLDPADFEDYLSVFQFGMPPHGGFGMGLERLTMLLLRLKNIREASLFPSDPKRIASKRLKAKIFFGAENIRNEILRLLRDNDIEHQHLVHEATPTSEDSARVRKTRMEEGVKALIVRGKTSGKNWQVLVQSHLKLDMKAVSEAVGEKCEFESPETIEQRYGLKVGGVPPFGNLLNLETLCDDGVTSEQRAAFNCGMQTESIVMPAAALVKLVEPRMGRFQKA